MINIENDFMNDNFREIIKKDQEFTRDLLKVKPINEEQNKYMIFIGGRAAIPYQFNLEADAYYFIERNSYSLIFALIAAMIDANNKITQQNKENETNNTESENNTPAE